MKLNPLDLKTGDIVSCDGVRDGFAAITRIVSGPKTRPWYRRMHDHDISTHTGIITTYAGQRLVAEMRPNGLELNSIENYRTLFGLKPREVIVVQRVAGMTDDDRTVLDQAMALDLRRGIEYAYKDLPRFVLKRVKQDKQRMYCSEYVYWLLKGRFEDMSCRPGMSDHVPDAPIGFLNLVSPQALMTYGYSSSNITQVWHR